MRQAGGQSGVPDLTISRVAFAMNASKQTATATATATAPPAQVATPVFNPDGGEYVITQPRSVTISTTTANANMRYTLNGTIPSQTNGNLIASNHGTVSVTPTSEGTTLRAIAFAPGMSDSDVHEATYTYIGGNMPNPDGTNSIPSGITPGYDANGNLIAYKGWSYTYDAQDRLTGARGTQKGSATVLGRKSKFRIFEEVVGEDDELSHEGSESEFFWFATSDETEVERSEDRVVPGGDEGGHVEDRADLRAAAEDMALTAELTAVVVKGSDAGEGGGLGIGEGT